MPLWAVQLIEAIARVFVRAALDELAARQKATDEVPNDDDRAVGARIAAAVDARLRREAGDPGPVGATPSGKGG
jgi:Na+-transporting methylmalonyl-CoA/oxaloacetate decarboxylase gamma subunit